MLLVYCPLNNIFMQLHLNTKFKILTVETVYYQKMKGFYGMRLSKFAKVAFLKIILRNLHLGWF